MRILHCFDITRNLASISFKYNTGLLITIIARNTTAFMPLILILHWFFFNAFLLIRGGGRGGGWSSYKSVHRQSVHRFLCCQKLSAAEQRTSELLTLGGWGVVQQLGINTIAWLYLPKQWPNLLTMRKWKKYC